MFPFCITCGAARCIYVLSDQDEFRYCHVCGSFEVKMCGNWQALAVPHITRVLTHNQSSSLAGDLLTLQERLRRFQTEEQ